jgi:hypothetical protein
MTSEEEQSSLLVDSKVGQSLGIRGAWVKQKVGKWSQKLYSFGMKIK